MTSQTTSFVRSTSPSRGTSAAGASLSILGVIDPVAESRNLLLFRHMALTCSTGCHRLINRLQDVEDSLIGATVERTFKRAYCGRDGRVHIRKSSRSYSRTKVEAFSSWSACKIRAISRARSAVTDGRVPVNIHKKFAECEEKDPAPPASFLCGPDHKPQQSLRSVK